MSGDSDGAPTGDASCTKGPANTAALKVDDVTDDSSARNASSSSPEAQDSADPIAKSYPPLAPYDLFGWTPDPDLSDDENYMDVVLLITRHSVCDWQGHMGSIIVDPDLSPKEVQIRRQRRQQVSEVEERGEDEGGDPEEEDEDEDEGRIRRLKHELFSRIIAAATNSPLYGADDSDIHAEIDALGQACKSRMSAEGCTIYITMHPCRRCFAALVAFGVRRIVSRRLPSDERTRRAAKERGIEMAEFTMEQNRAQMERINGLVNGGRTDEELMRIAAERRKRKEMKRIGQGERR